MKRKLAIILCALILGSSALSLGGCGMAANGTNDSNNSEIRNSSVAEETPDISDNDTKIEEIDADNIRIAVNAFSAELFKQEFSQNENHENTLISPLSVYTALAMLNNGAASETKEEITDILSGYFKYIGGAIVCYAEHNPISTEDINRYFLHYINSQYYGDVIDTKLSMANSVWTIQKDGRVFNEDFLSSCRDYYCAEIFNEKLNLEAVRKINGWVSQNTDGMIDRIVDDSITETDLAAVLLNAISFEGQWDNGYSEEDIEKREFNNYDGTKTEVDFMSSVEERYLDDGKAIGFVKDYCGNSYIKYTDERCPGGTLIPSEPRYCFVALMPNEDIGIDEYISEYFSDITISDAIENARYGDVYAKLPKFDFDCTYSLVDSLQSLGIESAFDRENADFSGLTVGENDIYISEILHKTHIEVDENGTKAAAITAVFAYEDECEELVQDTYSVVLNRPFVFAIYDYDEKIPVFIGTVMNESN